MTKKKILIATGGTGGHIFPAYSLANNLNNSYDVIITSDKRGLNYLKNYKNINFVEISSSPLVKKNILKLFVSILIIIFSIIKSLIFLLFNRPSMIFGMGGYSSFPVCVAAYILKIKFIIYENNLIIGKANKYLLPLAQKIFVSYKELEGISEKYNDKICEVGNIIREEIINSNFSNFDFNKSGNINLLVLGGSQAARIFADDLPKIFEKLKNSGVPITVFQQCQKKQHEKLSQFYEKTNIQYEIFNFTDKINNYYSKANLVITRSGASALGELINVNVPFITIPLPTSADNHQLKNAEFYEKKGYGLLLKEKDIKDKLFDLIYSLYNNKILIKNILSKQSQHSDKEIFKNLQTQIKKILNEEN